MFGIYRLSLILFQKQFIFTVHTSPTIDRPIMDFTDYETIVLIFESLGFISSWYHIGDLTLSQVFFLFIMFLGIVSTYKYGQSSNMIYLQALKRFLVIENISGDYC